MVLRMKKLLIIIFLGALISACTPNTNNKKSSSSAQVNKSMAELITRQQAFIQQLSPLILTPKMNMRFHSGTREDEEYKSQVNKQRQELVRDYSQIKDWDCYAYGILMPQDLESWKKITCGAVIAENNMTPIVTYEITLTDQQAASIKKIYTKDKIRFSGLIESFGDNSSEFGEEGYVKFRINNPTKIEIVR